MARKNYDIPDDTLNMLQSIMKKKGIKTENSAIIYLINQYEEQEAFASSLIKEMDNKFKNLFTGIRLASRESQKNTTIILDALNTMLYESDVEDLLKAKGITRHPVVKQSEEAYQKMIEQNKQIADNEKLKKGE